MPEVNPWLIVARSVHLAASILLFGQLVFTRLIARDHGLARAGVRRTLAVCIVVVLLSGAAWLVLLTASVTGEPARHLHPHTVSVMLTSTTFGRVWMLRAALLVVISLALGPRAPTIALVAALACLASLAWAGHAAAGVGAQRGIEITSDVLHLLAAGAWLGALPALTWMLAHEPEAVRLHHVVRRFSTYGVASVAALVATGMVNAWYRVGSVAALLQTDYGRLLIVKLLLVAAMVTLAASNRYRWTPRLLGPQPQAVRALRRSTVVEIAAGMGTVVVVGAMGVTVPAAHSAMQHTMSALHMGH